jgi:hypothetical protein
MKHTWKIIAALAVTVSAAACESEPVSENEANASQELVEVPGRLSAPSPVLDEGSSERLGTSREALRTAAEAQVTCTVVKVQADAYCPNTISGYGRTTFLGSCAKARRRAREDARSQLGSGCALGTCSFSGC